MRPLQRRDFGVGTSGGGLCGLLHCRVGAEGWGLVPAKDCKVGKQIDFSGVDLPDTSKKVTNIKFDIHLHIVQHKCFYKKPLVNLKHCAGSAEEFLGQLHTPTHIIECQVHAPRLVCQSRGLI